VCSSDLYVDTYRILLESLDSQEKSPDKAARRCLADSNFQGQTLMTAKKSTAKRIGSAVADAASTVASAAERRVIQPVGHALGLIGEKPKKAGKKRGAKSTLKTAVKKVVAGAKAVKKQVKKGAAKKKKAAQS